MNKLTKRRLQPLQVLTLGYIAVILMGTLLLALPISNRQGVWTPFVNALFTATSATCVTGLVVYDTFLYFNVFGQLVILLLIQIGGISFMTFIVLGAILLRRKIGLFERTILAQSAGLSNLGGVVKLFKRILVGTAIFELCGTLLLSISFVQDYGAVGIYYAFFTSVSAFCNAGFDLMGASGNSFVSLTLYRDDVLVNLTVIALIVIGGLGFVVWGDIWDKRFRFRNFRLHTKVVLVATALLIFIPAVLIGIFENNATFRDLSWGEKILAALFQSVTTRTAGFNTVDLTNLSDSSVVLMSFLMLIGGNSGSTAGGIKVTTFVVVIFGLWSSIRNRQDINIGKRRLDLSLTRQAIALLTIYLGALFVSTMIICAIEPFGLSQVLFETTSAIATVGLTLGITTKLTVVSKLILIFLMFAGRMGVLGLAVAFGKTHDSGLTKRPLEKIIIG